MAAAVMAAGVQRRRIQLILNVPNHDAIGGLRDDDVVEVTCFADEHGAQPIAQGAVPDAALGALLAHPLVPSYAVARAIID